MSLPSGTTVQNLIRCRVYPGWFPSPFVDQFLRKVRFEPLSSFGRAVTMNQIQNAAVAAYEAGGALGLVPGLADPRAFNFRRMGDTVEVDGADIDASGGAQLAVQVEMKKAALLRHLAAQVIEGDGISPNLTGLAYGTEPAQSVAPQAGAGTAPTLDDYHRLLAMVQAPDAAVGAGPDALVMHPRTRRQLLARMQAGGGCPDWVPDEDLGVAVATFDGLPIFTSEQVSTTEDAMGFPGVSDLTSVYALKLHGPTGVRVLHQGGDDGEYGVTTTEVPAQLSPAVRAVTVRGYYAVYYPWIRSLARLRAIDISAFPD